MKPHSSKIRSILPYSLPLFLSVLAVVWMMVPRDAAESTVASSLPPQGSKASRVESASIAEERAKRNVLIQAQENGESAPRNPEVVEILNQFREGDRMVPQSAIKDLGAQPKGKRAVFKAAGIELAGTIDSKQDSSGVLLLGMTLDDELGRFQMSLRPDGKIIASVLFNGESHALLIKGFPENGSWQIQKSTVAEIYCAPAGATYPIGADETWAFRTKTDTGNGKGKGKGKGKGNPTPAKSSFKVPDLSSDAESTFVLYIDFDGEVVTNPAWNDGETIDAQPSSFAEDEAAMTIIWQRVAEDYKPFDLNVTTNREVYDSAAPERRQMCIMTTTQFFIFDLAGIATLNSFGQEIPCWGFDDFNLGDDAYHGETISHEVGHTMGLLHQSDAVQEYYPGHGTGLTSWAPIMGDFSQDVFQPEVNDELTTWSNSEFTGATRGQDDLNILTTQNGFGYRRDDKGNSEDTATPLIVIAGEVADLGLIERNTDEDWFRFATSGGPVTIDAKGLDVNSSAAEQRGSNLPIGLELFNSDGELLQASDPPNDINAAISADLPIGNYYVKVQGVGKGNPSDGVSKYGSLGQYFLTGTIPQVGLLTIDPLSSEISKNGGPGRFTVTPSAFTGDDWEWTSSEPWVTSDEPLNQSGRQVFDFTVAPNLAKETRTASITITSGGITASHIITQKPADDHGDVISQATVVAQRSVTNGDLEEEYDLDVFRINVRGFGNLAVKTTGTTDTFGELLDVSGTRILSNDNFSKPNFRIVYSVAPGTYYVRVRHALGIGIGKYKLSCWFEEGPALAINPRSRTVSASKSKFGFDVISNAAWSWSSNASWLKVREPKRQNGGQFFEYTVMANPNQRNRSAQIVFKAGGGTFTHTVTQNARLVDDHGDSSETATNFATNSNINGKLNAQGDEDWFRIRLAVSGQLRVASQGSTDTFGKLVDDRGREIASNDDSDGVNFGITQNVNAGVYYVAVSHFDGTETGSYSLSNSFTPSSLINLRYSSTSGGNLRGNLRQTVRPGGAGARVVAIPAPGFAFQRWSDGLKSPIRLERDVRSHVNVVARFVRTMSLRVVGGPMLDDNQVPPVDFGTVRPNQTRRISFQIRNNGNTVLTGLRVGKSGPDPSSWRLSLGTKTLRPGRATTLTAVFRGNSLGAKLAVFTVSAKEAGFRDFRVQAMGQVALPIRRDSKLAKARSDSRDSRNRATMASSAASGGSSSAAKGKSVSGAAVSQSWVAVSPDGLFRYRFFREKGDDTVPELWISTDGIDWQSAAVSSVRKVGTVGKLVEFEATLAPWESNELVIVISEISPIVSNQ